jgi:hypothetical protein
MSRSICSRFTSRRSFVSSSHSMLVSASGGPFPASMSARWTHSRSEVSVRSRSFATCPILRSPPLQSRTASALNSGVNARRRRLPCRFAIGLYAPSVIKAYPTLFNSAWFTFWGL